MKILRVGDPHAKVSNLAEGERLMQFILGTAITEGVGRIEILGDLMHTHSVLRLEVIDFWSRWLPQLAERAQTVVLVGNHDQSGDHGSKLHGLAMFAHIHEDLTIIQHPVSFGNFGYMPYIHDNAKFVTMANELTAAGAKVIVSHTTYNGSKFESGMFAPDGVDPELLDAKLLISGHIHSRQRYKTSKGQDVIYPGTARWDTASDANQEKGIWLVEHGADGMILKEEFIDTSHVCTPIVSIQVKEGEEVPTWTEGARVSLELIGSSDWIKKTKSNLKGKCSIKTKITDAKKHKVRTSGTNFMDYATNVYQAKVDKEKLFAFMKEVGLV